VQRGLQTPQLTPEQRHRRGLREDLPARLPALSILPDAVAILGLLPAWFDDYNTIHPHSALRFQSPAESHKLNAQPNPDPVRRNGVHSIG
jgi:transposase InsO family protein